MGGGLGRVEGVEEGAGEGGVAAVYGVGLLHK